MGPGRKIFVIVVASYYNKAAAESEKRLAFGQTRLSSGSLKKLFNKENGSYDF